MPIVRTPGVGLSGPTQTEDPLSALSSFLGVQPSSGGGPDDSAYTANQTSPEGAASVLRNDLPSTSIPSVSTPLRNQALSAAIARKYGIPGAADGSASQSDLEALDSFMRGNDVADKVAESTAPIEAQGRNQANVANINGRYALEGDRIKGDYGLQGERIKGDYGLQDAQTKAQAAIEAATAKAAAGGAANQKFGATENRALEALQGGMTIANQLDSMLDPNKNQLMDKLEKVAQYKLYQNGISSSPVSQERMQLAGLLKVLGAAPYVAGSRHFQFMQQAQEHLTDPTATDAFLHQQIVELKRIWPELQQGILTVHDNPHAPLPVDTSKPQQPADPYADPNYIPK